MAGSGDGKTSPFGAGNGKGAPGAGGTFDLQKGTGPQAAGKAAPFDASAQKNPQATYTTAGDPSIGGASGVPAGGTSVFADIKPPNPERAREIGAGSIGSSQMPFKVRGGAK
jgi:hypothetical protein